MATEEELNNQRNLNSEINESISLEQQIIDLLSKRRGIDSSILSEQQDINNVLKDQVKNMDFEVVQRKQIKDLSASVSKIASEAYSISKSQLGLTSTNVNIVKQQEALSKSIILLEQQKEQLLTNVNNGTASNVTLNKDIADSISDQVSAAGKLKNDLDTVAKNSKEISGNFGVKSFGGMAEITKAIPGLSKFSGPMEEAGESARSMAANIQEAAQSGGKGLTKEKIKQLGLDKKLGKLTGSAASNVMKGMSGGSKAMMAMKAGAKALGPMLTKALGPVGLIIEAVKAFMQIDKAAGETAKSMGISAAEGAKMNAEMADAAAMSGDLLVSSKDVVKANMELNKIFGTSVAFSGEMAVEFAAISEKTGLSSKAMGVFAEKAMLSGTSIKDQLKKVTAVTMEMSAQTGVMLNAKDIQEGIGEMSHAQMLTTGMNTKEMAKQVFQAKMLGVSQSQLASMGDSLLDFESSIAAEMEAELLTGKQLNLEGARAAALKGDQAALAAELRKEVGTAAEFGKMNVIQQQAMAKAFGMSREDMAGMLVEQEKLESVKAAGFKSASDAQEQYNKALEDGTLTEELKNKLAKAGVLNQMESATTQDKMNAAMEKLSDLFVQLVDPLMPIIDALMAILDPIFAILSPILKLVGDLVGLIVTILMPAFDALKGMFDTISGSMTDAFGGVAEIIEGILNMDFGMILSGLSKVAQAGINLILMPIQAMVDLILGVINTFINFANKIPGVDMGTIESPDLGALVGEAVGLEDGGIVTGPTNSLIGEGSESEAVLPLSKLANMLPNGLAIGDAVLNAATAPMRGIMNTIGSIFDQGDIGDALKNPVSGLMDTIGGIFSSESLGDILKNPLEAITSPMKGIGKLTDMLPSMSSPMSGIGEMFSSAKSGISNFLGTGDDKEINNEEVSLLLKELITTVKEGGDVYLDGTKVGYTLALQSSKMA